MCYTGYEGTPFKLSRNSTKYKLTITSEAAAANMVQRWERIYLEEGVEGLMKERRGRACAAGGTRKGRPHYNNERISTKLK